MITSQTTLFDKNMITVHNKQEQKEPQKEHLAATDNTISSIR